MFNKNEITIYNLRLLNFSDAECLFILRNNVATNGTCGIILSKNFIFSIFVTAFETIGW